jgi:hypothetical protein
VAALPSEVGAVVYVAVKVHCDHCGPRVGWHHEMDCGTPLGPPSVLADLDDKTCETCGGEGMIEWDQSDDCLRSERIDKYGYDEDDFCSDCAGTGRALLTIQHECEWCGGEGWLMGEPDHYERGTEAVIDCVGDDGERCDDGVVTDPRRWTVDGLWPVVHVLVREPPLPCLIVGRGNAHGPVYELWDGERLTQITVTGPLPSPGDWIVALTLAVTA